MIELRPASYCSLDARATLLNTAYADYFVPLRVSVDQMATMDALYDVDPARSVVAVDDGDPVGMALLSLRNDRGWISAVGVVKERRKEGIARLMMGYLLRQAEQVGVRELLLEVIDENEPARRLYDSLGFAKRRELLTWRFPPDGGPLPIPEERLLEVDPAEALGRIPDWRAQPACWQRETESLQKMTDRLRAFRLDMHRQPAAYCLVSDRSEALSILDVGIDPEIGAARGGRILLQALWFLYRGRPLSIMNVPADDPLSRVLAALHFLVTIRQIEMGRLSESFASNGLR